MTDENWQRLRNLSLFKLWITDKELRRLSAVTLLIALLLAAAAVARFLS